MSTSPGLQAWIAFWRWRRLYHGYRVDGLEHLLGPRAALIVGYHGRPFAYDLCMLGVEIYERRGYLPHAIVHRGVESIPPLRWLKNEIGFVTGDEPALAAAVGRGEHVMVTPGGALEGTRGFEERYRVHWGDSLGYLRLALRHRLPVVPVATDGADDTFFAPWSADTIGRALRIPRDWRWLTWLGVGPLGLWPLSPPFPVRLRQRIGEPIHLEADGTVHPDDLSTLRRLHARVQSAVQQLLDRARGART